MRDVDTGQAFLQHHMFLSFLGTNTTPPETVFLHAVYCRAGMCVMRTAFLPAEGFYGNIFYCYRPLRMFQHSLHRYFILRYLCNYMVSGLKDDKIITPDLQRISP